MQPLAERIRPKQWTDIIGQQHLVGQEGILTRFLQKKYIPSMILWGPPGIGKTTIAFLLAQNLERNFFHLSAIQSGVKDVREVIEKAEKNLFNINTSPILFIDEIHRFNKSQQDALLAAVEKGIITLIGATTENPSFEVIPALLSRMQVFTLHHLSKDDMMMLLNKALQEDDFLKQKKITLEQTDALFAFSGGDARKLLNALEAVVQNSSGDIVVLNNETVRKILQQNVLYDKSTEQHYDIISAFIKSIRGSDADAALYWMAIMLSGGEDPLFIARRLVILAAEDIGLANPNALLLVNACFDAVNKIGMPEARIVLSEAVIYLSLSPKSNSAYLAIDKALEFVSNSSMGHVPLHLRNAPTALMKELNYGANYIYPHNYKDHYVNQSYWPDNLTAQKFYTPSESDKEKAMFDLLEKIKKNSKEL